MDISVITLSWDNLAYTQAFVRSIRKNTQLPYELIIVDNGSEPETQEWVKQNADHAIIFSENQGFSAGFNHGLKKARGEYVMMANNDTEFPPNWDRNLTETLHQKPRAGIVSPVYTSGMKIAKRKKKRNRITRLKRYQRYPSGVAYFMRRQQMIDSFKGWCEDYHVASGEDADLCFTVWHSGYDILLDERVLIQHAGHVTSNSKLSDRKALWEKNANQFQQKWGRYYRYPRLMRLIEILQQSKKNEC